MANKATRQIFKDWQMNQRKSISRSLRNRVFNRADGKCERCKCDLLQRIATLMEIKEIDNRMNQIIQAFQRHGQSSSGLVWAELRDSLYQLRLRWPELFNKEGEPLQHCYEIDHIRQVARSGTNEFDNLRLLCLQCHANQTKQFFRDLSVERKESQSERRAARKAAQAEYIKRRESYQ